MPLCICIFLCCLQWWQALTKGDSWVLYRLLVSLQPVITTHNCLHVTTLYLTGWYSLSSSSWMYCDLYNLSLIMLYCRCAKNTTLQEKKNWLRPKLMQWETNQSSHINAFMYMHFSMLLIQWRQALTKDDSWVHHCLLVSLQPVIMNHNCLHVTSLPPDGTVFPPVAMHCDL